MYTVQEDNNSRDDNAKERFLFGRYVWKIMMPSIITKWFLMIIKVKERKHSRWVKLKVMKKEEKRMMIFLPVYQRGRKDQRGLMF